LGSEEDRRSDDAKTVWSFLSFRSFWEDECRRTPESLRMRASASCWVPTKVAQAKKARVRDRRAFAFILMDLPGRRRCRKACPLSFVLCPLRLAVVVFWRDKDARRSEHRVQKMRPLGNITHHHTTHKSERVGEALNCWQCQAGCTLKRTKASNYGMGKSTPP
jgi:hypothetical protein